MEFKKLSLIKLIVFFVLLITLYSAYLDLSEGFVKVLSFQKIGLLLALLIILFTNNYLLKSFDILLNSFKKIKVLIIILIVDALFFGLAYLLFKNALQLFSKITIESLNSEQAVLNDPSIIISYLKNIGFIGFGVLIAVFLIYTLSRSIIWRILVKKSLSINYFANFFKYNFVWCLFWFIPLILVFFGLIAEFKQLGVAYLIIVFAHFSGVLHYSIALEKNILKNFGLLSLGMFYYLLTPYALIYTGYIILITLFEFLLPTNYFAITSYALFLLAMNILRISLTEIFNWLVKKK